ncbi:ScbR family autoregulator-binding transcription factor [Streptomyces sp. NPDC006355]|uniref:ScbR family autoregulator-binding transcription factor n=1 Tax=Streptomyces sp. NPDC006355 TaxID=3156758 RepID=UPI0033BE49A8
MKQERAARTRQVLVRVAGEEFAHRGFESASLRRISARAGVSYGGLHHHFAGKQDLARAVVSEAVAILRDEVCAAPGPGEGAGATRFPALQGLIDATCRLMARLDQDAVVQAGFALSLGTANPDLGEDLREQWRCWVEGALAEAERARELGEGVRGADVAAAVVAATVGFEVLAAGDRSWLKPDVTARFWQLILPRIAAPAMVDGLLHGGLVAVDVEPAS